MRSGSDYPYPADEFDAAARSGGPRGAHRAPRSRWSRWWPFLVVLLVFPALAYAGVTWLSDWQGLPGAEQVLLPEDDDAEEPVDEGTVDDDAEEPEPEPEPEPTPTPTPTPEPDLTTAVTVFNSTTVAGLAANGAQRLEEAGFTDVSANNWTGAPPEASVVYYGDEDDAATAELVASTLGIGAVEESADDAADGLAVVLAADYTAA